MVNALNNALLDAGGGNLPETPKFLEIVLILILIIVLGYISIHG